MKRLALTLTAALAAGTLSAEDKKPKITFGFFADTYYAFDANQPPNRERPFTTVPTRHNEFTLNLAFVEGKLEADRLRGRLALQTGTSVAANYASELRDPNKNGVQLADLLQHVQEATAGYRLSDGLWIDAGIYLSHIGFESFLSRDNWTYTRSLIADFSPYYQAGVKLSYDASPQWSFQLHLLNGWQNILETNSDKALGTQVTYRPSDKVTVIHNGFLGRETELRIFQDLVVKVQISDTWESSLAVDLGFQRKAGGNGFSSWYGASLQNRFRWNDRTYVTLRVESYADPDGVIVPTTTPNNFQAIGASVNLDRQLTPELLFRNELRWLHTKDAVFPSDAGVKSNTVFGVTSLALSF